MKNNICTILLLFFITTNVFAQEAHTFKIANETFELKWLVPENMLKEVGHNEKLELGLRFRKDIAESIESFVRTNKDGIDPFNPAEINVEFKFISPSKIESKVDAFYSQDSVHTREPFLDDSKKYNWRLRFFPNEIGEWKFSIKIKIKENTLYSVGTKFKCIPSRSLEK